MRLRREPPILKLLPHFHPRLRERRRLLRALISLLLGSSTRARMSLHRHAIVEPPQRARDHLARLVVRHLQVRLRRVGGEALPHPVLDHLEARAGQVEAHGLGVGPVGHGGVVDDGEGVDVFVGEEGEG